MIQEISYAGMPGGWELVLIVLAVILLFGGKKIPELMKGLGKGIREFKDSSKELRKDSEKSESKSEEAKSTDKE